VTPSSTVVTATTVAADLQPAVTLSVPTVQERAKVVYDEAQYACVLPAATIDSTNVSSSVVSSSSDSNGRTSICDSSSGHSANRSRSGSSDSSDSTNSSHSGTTEIRRMQQIIQLYETPIFMTKCAVETSAELTYADERQQRNSNNSNTTSELDNKVSNNAESVRDELGDGYKAADDTISEAMQQSVATTVTAVGGSNVSTATVATVLTDAAVQTVDSGSSADGSTSTRNSDTVAAGSTGFDWENVQQNQAAQSLLEAEQRAEAMITAAAQAAEAAAAAASRVK
jgi:hypothetical protein